MIKRCAIYIRVSTAKQRMDGWSLDAQRAALVKYAEAKGWKVVGVYADEGKTARKRLKDRREIFRLLEDVKAGLVDVILFKELDRWFRNVSDFYKVQDVLDQYGVTWVSEKQPGLYMGTKEGRLSVNVMLSVGQTEADAASERVRYTNKYMVSLKRWTSGADTLPRGYTLDDDQHVIIDPEQEQYVRDLIAAFFRSGSIRGAMLEANSANGMTAHYNNIHSLLQNEMLCGEYKGIKDFVAEPYMTREDFDRMRGLMKKNASHRDGWVYIFSGLLVCGDCGIKLAGSRTCVRGKTYTYYKCNKAHMSALCGNPLRVNEAKLEESLMVYVKQALADKITAVQEIERGRKKAKIKGNREQIEKKLDKLEDLYISSDRMTKERYEEKRAAILAQLVEPEPEEQQPALEDLQAIRDTLEGPIELAYDGMTRLERRAFWRGILDSVTIRDAEIVGVDFLA